MLNSSIWPIDRTVQVLPGGPGSNANKGVLHIPQSSKLSGEKKSQLGEWRETVCVCVCVCVRERERERESERERDQNIACLCSTEIPIRANQEALPTNYLMSCTGQLLGKSYSSAEIQ